ncbi:MAG: hypothetical protein H7070_14460 [Saprospiraceae bacterium]|nr:hypothetical protein [Pyrinomonadaceae bacterium]
MNKKSYQINPSIWGSRDAGLVIEKDSVKIEYACASGEINLPLAVSADGSFKAEGTHTRLSPGPILIDSPPKARPAGYEGKITGKSMTLKVTLTETKEVIAELTLERDIQARITRCL